MVRDCILAGSGLEVIKLEYSLKFKIKRNDWLLADTIIALYFAFENELKYYNNLGVRTRCPVLRIPFSNTHITLLICFVNEVRLCK